MTAPRGIASVNPALAERMPDLARDLAGEPTSRTRYEWRYRGRDGGKDALSISIAGKRRGSWKDFHADAGGDALGLVAHLRRTSMRDALRWSLAWLGEAPSVSPAPACRPAVAPPEAAQEASPPRTLELGLRLWREAIPGDAPDSLVPVYLAARGLEWEADLPLRFHPRAWRNAANGARGPAMLAAMTSPETGEICGVHVTYLRHDGRGKAEGASPKIMLGSVGVIRLVPDADVTTGLGIGEGIETSLAIMQRAGWRPVWAATSAGGIARFPILAGIEALTVFADADGAGINAARTCCRRWADAGRKSRFSPPPAGDWDDALPRAKGAA